MTRILTPRGELKEAHGLKCFKEKMVSFAEKKKRVVILAERFDAEVNGIMYSDLGVNVCYGNLSSDKVREILSEMAEKGYYNFLDKGIEVIDSPWKIPALNGRPYYLEPKWGQNQPNVFGMGGGLFPAGGQGSNLDDYFLDEEEDEEE